MTDKGDRPRILITVENLSLARDLCRLGKQVDALVAAGFGVSVICRSDPDNGKFEGVRVYEYRAPVDAQTKLGFIREYLYSWTMAGLLVIKAFLAEGFDAIQTCGPPDIYFTIGVPFRLLGKPLVFDQRDVSPELYEARYGRRDGLAYRILRWLERASYRTADHVITVNDSLRDIAYLRGELLPGAVTVVGNGPALQRTHKRRPHPDLKEGKRYLCCWLGMMGPQDRVDFALRAIRHLLQERGRTDCHFTFIGSGESKAGSEKLSRELGLQDWVTFTGFLKEDEAFQYLSTADLGIEPNLEEIISPVKVMEYMAFQLPFVAFDLKETRVLADGAAAYAKKGDIIDFARAMDELLDDPSRRAEMGRMGRRRVEDAIAWDHQKNAYLNVFRKLLNVPEPSASTEHPCETNTEATLKPRRRR